MSSFIFPHPTQKDSFLPYPTSSSSAQKSKILVIDDSRGLRVLFKHWLEPFLEKLDIVLLEDGFDLQQHLQDDLKLAIMDVNLPDKNGIELAKMLRGRCPRTPVFLMSGVVDESLKAEARKAGVADIWRKPLSSSLITESVQYYTN